MAIVLKSVVFDIPRSGCEALLRTLQLTMCSDPPANAEILVGPYLNDVVPDAETVYGDLTFDDATMAPVAIADGEGVCSGVEGPALNPDEWALTADQHAFTLGADPGPVTAFGYAMICSIPGHANMLLGAIKFDEAVPMVTGDILKVVGQLVLLPQITPALP